MKKVAIIRGRCQLTIPEAIRKIATWVSPMSAVSITIVKPDEIIIKPHRSSVDADKVWEAIRKVRAIKGKAGNLSKFIAEDRYNH